METGLLSALLNISQQPAPESLKTPMADWATGVASAKIKIIQLSWGRQTFYTSPFVEQVILRYLQQSTKQDQPA